MGTKHRVEKALAVLVQEPDDVWAYETFTTGNNVHFVFDQARSARLVAQALHAIFKRKPLFHNGRKPRGRK